MQIPLGFSTDRPCFVLRGPRVDKDLGRHMATLANAVAAFVETDQTGPLLDAASLTAAITVSEAVEAGLSDDVEIMRAVVAMFHSCRQDVQAHDNSASAPPDVTWPLIVLGAMVSDQIPARLRSLAYAVTAAVTVESEARAAIRAVTRAIFQDDLDVLDASIATLLAAVDEADVPPRMRSRGRSKLAGGYWQRFDVTRDPTDLDRALAFNELVIADVEGRDLVEAQALRASLLLERFRITGAAEDLAGVEALCTPAAEDSAPLDHLTRELVIVLRNARLEQFETTNDLACLDAAIQLGERAVRNSHDGESHVLLAAHANAYVVRYEVTGTPGDLDKAIEYYRDALGETDGPPLALGPAGMLWDLLSKRLKTRPNPQDRDELIDLSQRLIPSLDGELRTDLEQRRSRLLWDRFGETLVLDDLSGAIDAACAVAERPEVQLSSGDLSNLCFMLQVRYRSTNDLGDLDAALTYGRRAVRLPHRDSAAEALLLSNLFGALTLRAEQGQEAGASDEARALLDEAIGVARRAADLFAPDDPEGTPHRNNLAVALLGRFQAGGAPEDLDRSIEYAQLSLAADPGAQASSSLGPVLLAALTMRLDRRRDEATLDRIVELINGGVDAAPAWVDSLGRLIGLLNRLADEGVPVDDAVRIDAKGLERFRAVRDGLLLVYEQCAVFMSMGMLDAGSQTRNLELVENAIGVLDHAMTLTSERRSPILIGIRGDFLIRRWQLTLTRADLDDAIASLIRSADLMNADDEQPKIMAANHRRSAATALVRRYRRRRNAADLDEAERQLLLAEPVFAEHEPEAHAELTSTLAGIQATREHPPLVFSHTDLLEHDREDLTSPYALANVNAWNRGEPRKSGLSWVHPGDAERGAQLSGTGAGTRPRILLLRTFKPDPLNFVVLNSIALAVQGAAAVEIVGDLRDRVAMDASWCKAFGDGAAVSDIVDLIPATDESWRREVLGRIEAADAVILHISPKDVDFPDFAFGPPIDQRPEDFWDRFMDSPLARPITGPGLLREICYLNRLQRLPDTVVVCEARYQPTLDDLIALGGTMGDATDPNGNLVTPRLTAIDKHVGHLRKAFRGITYRRPSSSDALLPDLASALASAMLDIISRREARERPAIEVSNLLGTSTSPRPLPPDGKLKVVAFTNVEDVLFLPSGELTEISHKEMGQILNREAVRLGCPYCRARLSEMFFFTRGLQRHGLKGEAEHDWPNGICQACGHKSSLFGDDMLAPQ